MRINVMRRGVIAFLFSLSSAADIDLIQRFLIVQGESINRIRCIKSIERARAEEFFSA